MFNPRAWKPNAKHSFFVAEVYTLSFIGAEKLLRNFAKQLM